MKRREGREHLWSIVLAGDEGVRAKELIRRSFVDEEPKRYCAFVTTRSMFQHTLDRAARLTPWERVAVVTTRQIHHEVWPQLDGRPAGMVLLQPRNVDTAAGIFLPLTFILARDPQATVVIHPSDRFIYPEDPFVSAVDHVVRGSNLLEGRPVLLAARSDGLELEYGWIKSGRLLNQIGGVPIYAVDTFFEKPHGTADLWNTMVLAAKGSTLWSLGWQCAPEMMALFERLKEVIDTGEEMKVLEVIYDVMPRRNFSSHFLQRTPERLAVMEMRDILWSDWGHPRRITDSLGKIGGQPDLLEEPLPFLYQG